MGSHQAPLHNNNGTIQADGGILQFITAGPLTNPGALTVTATGTLDNATAANWTFPSITMQGGSLISSTNLRSYSSTSLEGSGFIERPFDNLSGHITASGGVLKFENSATLSGASTLNLPTGGTFQNALAGAMNFPTVSMTGGTLAGSGGFTNSGANFGGWGTISAAVTNTNTGTMSLSGGSSSVTGTITNQGILNVAATATGTSFGTVNNSGTVHVTNADVTWGNFTNSGVFQSDPATQTFNNDLTVTSTGYLRAESGDIYQVKGNFISNSTLNSQLTQWNTTQATLAFITGTSSAHDLYITGADVGQNVAGYTDNFSWGALALGGQTLNLVDGNGTLGGALYVGIISGFNTAVPNITGNGLNIYYDASLGGNGYLGGQTFNLASGGVLEPFSSVPIPGSVLLLGSGLVGLGLMRFRRRQKKA